MIIMMIKLCGNKSIYYGKTLDTYKICQTHLHTTQDIVTQYYNHKHTHDP